MLHEGSPKLTFIIMPSLLSDSCRHTNVTCPVLVFFHPGGFARLSGGPETFAPDVWMGKDVVLVAPNYRC